MLPDFLSFAPEGILSGADQECQLHIVFQQVGEHDIISILPHFVSCLMEPMQSQFPFWCWLCGCSKFVGSAMSLAPEENHLMRSGLGGGMVSGLEITEGTKPLGDVRA